MFCVYAFEYTYDENDDELTPTDVIATQDKDTCVKLASGVADTLQDAVSKAYGEFYDRDPHEAGSRHNALSYVDLGETPYAERVVRYRLEPVITGTCKA